MGDTFQLLRDIFTSDAGSFGFVVAFLLLMYLVVYKATKFSSTMAAEHGVFGKRVDRIEDNTDKIKEEIMKLRAVITSRLPLTDPYLQAQSPMRLTPKGMDIAKDLEVERLVIGNWEGIYAFIDKNLADKNAYDIQQFCIEQATINLSSFFSQSDIEAIKAFAFKSGRPVEAFGGLIGIVIRDAYFKHKGISIDDVDKFDPDRSRG